jgi:hypothetical protein
VTAHPLAFDRPAASAAGDVGREGYSGAGARADHVHDRSSEAAGGSLFKKDTHTMTGTTGTWTLTYLPATDSLHVYNGASVLVEGTDYTLTSNVVSITSGVISGDVLVARYAYVPADAVVFADLIASLGPLAWYRLGDVALGGTMADSSGHFHHGSYINAAGISQGASLVDGDSNGALTMNGAGGTGATVPYGSWMNLTTNVSWVVLFKTTDASARLWAREQSTYVWSLQGFGGGTIAFLANGALIATSTGTSYNDGNKHMAVFTYDGTNVRIYGDGVIDKTQAYSTPLPTPTTVNDIITVGYGGGLTTAHMYTGDLDELMMFDRVLTPAEIAAIWSAAS